MTFFVERSQIYTLDSWADIYRMGFTNVVTLDEVKEAFPLLDIVDHGNRHYIAKHGITRSHSQDEFEPIEGEPGCDVINPWLPFH